MSISTTLSSDAESSAKTYKTVGYCAAFVALGLTHASLGPTLTALAAQTQTDLNQISFIFSARAAGYLVGSFFGGRLYDRMRGHLLMAGMLVLIALSMAVVPWMSVLWTLTGVLLLLGMFEGAVDVGGNTLLVWVHGEKVGPYMNALHFFFGVGAFLSPIIIAQVALWWGNILGAYWILGVLALPVAVFLFRLSSPRAPGDHNGDTDDATAAPLRTNALLVLLVAIFFFLYVGAEGSFGGWIATYAESMGLGDTAVAAYLTSAFWGALTLGRLLSIPITAQFTPRQVLIGDLVGCLLSIGVIVLWPNIPWVTWAGTFGAGFAMASMFPTMISLAERHMTITGKVTAWFFVGGSTGGMTLPWVIGQLFESVGPRVTIAAIFTNMVAAAGVFVLLVLLSRKDVELVK